MKNSYAPAPFWFLNHRLEEEELKLQIRLLKESGVSGFFIHPRAGLQTPYGSKEWFKAVRLIVEEAHKLKMEAWLYDEDPYPSGAAGGKIMMENPAYCARNLCCKIVEADAEGNFDADLGECDLLLAFTYRELPDGGATDIEDITDELGILREQYHKRPWNSSYYCDWIKEVIYPHVRAETFHPHMVLRKPAEEGKKAAIIYTQTTRSDDKYAMVPDCLNPKVVERFIELTHEKYKEWVGEYFGTTIPGIFTDEPFLGGYLPYTGALTETFAKLHGYEFLPNAYRLWIGTDETCHRFRRDYWATIKHLYRTSFYEPISDWCHANNLQFVGHVICEEDPIHHPASGGAYANMGYLDTPGMDILGQTLGNRERPALMYGAHSIQSAARQLGKERILCEAMACNPYSYGPRDMRRTTDWLYSQGINWIVPHGFHYSYDGYRKYDAGKSFFFQDAFFEEFPKYALYAERMGARLAGGKPMGTTALLQLSDRIAGYQPAETDKAIGARTQLFRAVAALAEQHIEYENISDETLAKGTISNGCVTVGCRTYTQVLIPAEDTFSTPLIEKMKDAGVALYFGQDGCFDWDAIKEKAMYTSLTGENSKQVLVNRQAYQDGAEMFLFNNDVKPAFIQIEEPKAWAVWDADEDAYYRPVWPLGISGYGACYLVEMAAEEIEKLPPVTGEAGAFEPLQQDWVYAPKEAVAILKEWDMIFDTASGKHIEERRDFCRVREVLGSTFSYMTEGMFKPIFDAVPAIESPYPAKTIFSTTFELSSLNGEKKRLLIEGSTLRGDWKLEVNGHQVTNDNFEKYRVYDFTNRAVDVTEWLQKGDNQVTVTWDRAEEFDGLESLMYII